MTAKESKRPEEQPKRPIRTDALPKTEKFSDEPSKPVKPPPSRLRVEKRMKN